MNSPHSALTFVGVSLRYPNEARNVVTDCSFSIGAGERVALLGLNGSGKTSLLMAACGVLSFEGHIYIDEIDLSDKTMASCRDRIGVLFSDPSDQILFPRVLDDVAFGLQRRGMDRHTAERIGMDFLRKFDIADLQNASPYALSHGQRLRVALAGALSVAPKILLLDEPSAGLDPRGVTKLASYLTTSSSAMLVATHDMQFAAQCCQRCIVLEAGFVVYAGKRFQEADEFLR